MDFCVTWEANRDKASHTRNIIDASSRQTVVSTGEIVVAYLWGIGVVNR